MKKALCILGLSCLAFAKTAQATIGASDYGYGAWSKGMGGTGVAQPQDGFSAAVNPALLSFLDTDHFDLGASVFFPDRSYSATTVLPPFLSVEPGRHTSGQKWFFYPNLAYATRITDWFSTGVAIYGNGGLSTDFHPNGAGSGFSPYPGVYGNGPAGAELRQLFVNVPFSFKLTPVLSAGVSLIVLFESMKAYGLSAFQPFSIAPLNVSHGYSYWTVGAGARVGALLKLTDWANFGIGFQPEIVPGRLKAYDGLLANARLDAPSTFTAGFNLRPTDKLQVNIDFQRILYENSPAWGNLNVCNPFSGRKCLGGVDGTGFGFQDVNVIKFGLEYRYDDWWTFRGGYAYNSAALRSSQLLLQLLATAVVQDHITVGFTRKINRNNALKMFGLYVPNRALSGLNGFNPTQRIRVDMNQFEIGAAWAWTESLMKA